MLDPIRVDALVDLAYGTLIALSIALIATVDSNVGIAFGGGVFASYVIHVIWKMARFDPDWMTQTVQETVEESIDETIEERVSETVERTVEDQLGELQGQIEALDDRSDRRSREDDAETLTDESVEGEQAETAEDG
jgi:hypothetical protein